MSDNPRHIVQRYYVAPSSFNISGVWSMKEAQQATYDTVWSAGLIPTVNYLLVGGGGGGGNTIITSNGGGGGGGAGGVVVGSFGPAQGTGLGSNPSLTLISNVTITLGTGGAGGTGSGVPGTNGTDTILTFPDSTVVTAYGGGGGGGGANGYGGIDGLSGGSGGGGSSGHIGGLSTQGSGTVYTGYGNRGGGTVAGSSGAAGESGSGGSGGGGAGGPGLSVPGNNGAGAGGPGLAVVAAGSTSMYAAGGSANNTQLALIYPGSGGDHGIGITSGTYGGYSGQDGTVIFWYSTTYPPARTLTGSYTYAIRNGYHVYTFSSNGTLVF